MCGFVGLIAKKNIEEERFADFIKSSELINHRGPDYRGVFREKNVLLIHYRLSILDLEKRSNQPFLSRDKNLLTVYNGEIYNYLDLKTKHKITTKTESDTEVMLESFNHLGEEAIKEWNGIFALSILSKKENSLFLIRDRLGIKPLYIYEDDNVIAFGSEAKVILNWLENFQLNYEGLAQYMWLGNTSGNETIIKNLYKVDPGTSVKIDLDNYKRTVNTYWSVENNYMKFTSSEQEVIKKLRKLLDESVKRQLISDVPIGVLLSGGIDSSSVVAHAAKNITGKLDTYTAFYDYNSSSKEDLLRARKISKLFNTNHHEIEVKGGDIEGVFKKMVLQFDEPFGDAANIPLYQIADLCSKDKRVILQGDGGDELFAGYRKYNVIDSMRFWKYSSFLYPLIPQKNWKHRIKRVNEVLNQKTFSDLLAHYISLESPKERPYDVFSDKIKSKLNLLDWKKDFHYINDKLKELPNVQKGLFTDLKILLPNTYLEKVDKATMLCSVEARVPMLDNELVEFAMSLDSKLKVHKREKKYLLKKALEGTIPNEILYGPKKGFDAPYQQWLKKDLFSLAEHVFNKANSDVINREYCLKLLYEHKSGIKNNAPILWKTLILCYWLDYYKEKIKFTKFY